MEENAVPARDPMPALYAALAKAQYEFQAIPKNRTVTIKPKDKPQYTFRYADLEAVLSATRPALAKNGLAVIQVIRGEELVTQLVHSEGGTISSSVALPNGFADIKNYGAFVMYLRRYAYCSLLCVAADDDLDENGEPADDSKPAGAAQALRRKGDQQELKPSPTNQEGDAHLQEPLPIGDAEERSDPVTAGMVGVIQAKLKASNKTAEDLAAHFGIESIDQLPRTKMNAAMDWIKS